MFKWCVVFSGDESSVTGPFDSSEEAGNYLEAERARFPGINGEVCELYAPSAASVSSDVSA